MPEVSTTGLVAALDIGGTKTTAALVTAAGEVVGRHTAPTPGRSGAAAVLDTAAGLVEKLRADAPDVVRALGVGSAGVIDSGSGLVLSATDVLTGWAGTDLRGDLARRLGVPVTVINDVHAHALGEARHGVAAGYDTVLYVAVGTGVGASFVLGDTVLAGAHSAAGHAGHQPSAYAGTLPCTCGGRGHLEAMTVTLTNRPTLRRQCRGRVSGRSTPGELTSSWYSPATMSPPDSSAASRAADTARETSATASRLIPPSASTITRTTCRRPARETERSSRS